jgi:hypothetical protein
VQRNALALGNNLITSNDESWGSQRSMIQPAFTKSAVGCWNAMMASVRAELLRQWPRTRQDHAEIGVRRGDALMPDCGGATLRPLRYDFLQVVHSGYRPAAAGRCGDPSPISQVSQQSSALTS